MTLSSTLQHLLIYYAPFSFSSTVLCGLFLDCFSPYTLFLYVMFPHISLLCYFVVNSHPICVLMNNSIFNVGCAFLCCILSSKPCLCSTFALWFFRIICVSRYFVCNA